MTSKFNVEIEVDAKEKTNAVFDAVNIDNKFYPENPTKTKISYNKKIILEIDADQIPQLRANLNSTLRLIQAAYESINSVKI